MLYGSPNILNGPENLNNLTSKQDGNGFGGGQEWGSTGVREDDFR